MTILISNVSTSTDSFGQWINKTNQAIFAVAYRSATSGNTLIGNVNITGTYTSNNLTTNNVFLLGKSASNTVANGIVINMQSSSTSNTLYTANGMTINGTVQYKSNIMQLGSSIIRNNSVTSVTGTFSDSVSVGSNIIFPTYATFNTMNVVTMWVSANARFGTTESNTYIDKDGLQVFDNRTGFSQSNSKLTSTTLWVQNIFANNITANNLDLKGTIKIDKLSSNIVFEGNTTFLGQNNHFQYGLSSNVFILIGPNFKGPQTTSTGPSTTLLSIKPSTVTGAKTINGKSSVTLESSDDNSLEFRSATNKSSGLVFVDDNQAGYLYYKHSDDILRFGAKTGFNFDTGTEDAVTGFASKSETPVRIDRFGLHVNNSITIRGIGSGVCVIQASTNAGNPIFTLPVNVGTADQVLKTDGTGVLSFGTVTSVPPITTDLEVNSLGVGVAASGVRGEIRATNDITAFYSSDRTLKENIKPISNSLEKLNKLNGVSFDWVDEYIAERGGEDGYFVRKSDIGVIAQEVEEVLPEAVATREDGIKAVKYERIIPLLIEAIKELQQQVNDLKNGN
jgi:hypothetical protein